MIRSKPLFSALLLIATVVSVPAVNAQTVKVIAAGSSAMFQGTAIAVFQDLAGANAHHFTTSGNCTSGPCGFIDDTGRSNLIPAEGGNLWVVWDSTQSNVWAYISVDSVVGNRAFFAVPRTTLDIDSDTLSPGHASNLINSTIWGSDDATLPTAIYNALNLTQITAAATDIRPEDAYYASIRVINSLDTVNYEGLGYGSGPGTLIGTPILSAFTPLGASANPVEFSLDGQGDPFDPTQIVPASTTIPVGAAPILFLINKTNHSDLGAVDGSGNPIFKNIATADVKNLFDGDECDGNAFNAPTPPPNFPVQVMLREPLSGTMNTTEFTMFRLFPGPLGTRTQEKNVNPAVDNPLGTLAAGKPCVAGGGSRRRVIGTGQMVNTGVKTVADSIGYAFFSYGNVSQIANTTDYGYLTVDGVDGLNSSYSDGKLPLCVAPTFCPATAGSTYPHLRDGTYRTWSILRIVTDASGPNLTNAQAMVTAAQTHINDLIPDFVPFVGFGGDPGLLYYRSHFTPLGQTVTPNNGLGALPEAGGDVGGCIYPRSDGDPGTLGKRQDDCARP